MTIREMEIDDLTEVMAIENENFSVPWTEMGFFSFLMRDDTLFLVAEEQGHILGYMGIMTVLDEGEITNVSVAKTARRRGVARGLVSEMIARMKSRKVKVIHLEVRKSNEAAIALYTAFGFVQDGERKGYYEEPVEDALLMSYHMNRENEE